MLKPHEMASVIITGPKNMQERIIEALHSMKILHIADHSKNELSDIGVPFEAAQRYSEILVKARALISALGIKKEETYWQITGTDEMEKTVSQVNGEVLSISEEIRKINELKAKKDSLIQELEMLDGINVPIESISGMKSLACFTGFAKDSEALNKIRNHLSRHRFEIFHGNCKEKIFAVVFVDSKAKDYAAEILQKNDFILIPIVHSAGLKGTASSNLENESREISKLLALRGAENKKLEKLKFEKKASLLSIEDYLSDQVEKAEAPLRFANTKSSFLIKGWIPREDLHKSIERLEKAGKGKIHIHNQNPGKHDKVPVKLNNPKFAKPFEFFIDLYSYPTHKEIDPTLFMFFTFPLFFGFMLGDIGYGLVGLLIFWIAKQKFPEGKRLLNSLIVAAFVSIFFGFLFGEFFGYEIMHPLLKSIDPLFISREESMMQVMYYAIGLGVIHINIGLIAGFVNELKSHGFMHAVYAKFSWIILEAGIVLVALPKMTSIIIPSWIAYAVIGLAVIMLFKGEGIRGLIELPSIFTNILSYARLMAIGLSSVIIAVIVNDNAFEMIHAGGFMVIAGMLILILGHALNILLGLFGGFLHSLRLHYVEFFSKFFQGGGKRYVPFGLKE